MTFRRPALIASACFACLSLSVIGGCDTDESAEPETGLRLSDLTDNVETPADTSVEPTGQSCQTWGAAASCLDQDSAAFCGVFTEDLTVTFGVCTPLSEIECVPGDAKLVEADCGELQSDCLVWDGVPGWTTPSCADGGETPLVLRFDDAPIRMIASDATPMASFDISMAADGGSCITTDWPSAATPWLAIDLDHSGTIDGGHELFGSGTDLAGGKAPNGFLALAAYDHNHDGLVDARDPGFAQLVLWRDEDADRLSAPGELQSLGDAGVERLAVHYEIDRSCDARGNCEIERAVFSHAGGRGEIVDLHLACQ